MKILIIDSDRLSMAKFYLENKDNSVYGAFTNNEAIDLLKEHKFDYISFGDNLPVVKYMVENNLKCDTARVTVSNLEKAKKIMVELIKGDVTSEVIQSSSISMKELIDYVR
jgi:translation initiation factor IF-3